MVYSEILLNTKPWTSGAVVVGIIAEDPQGGQLKILRAGTSPRDPREKDAVDRFLSSLKAVAKSANEGKGQRSVAALLKHVPDRGTSFQFSALRSGEFNSVAAALKHCLAERMDKPAPRPALVNPVVRPATA